ncbi:zinc-ribbon domain-containing protein [Archangium primigenium]|uniref:zinc-ribbon domain-containing protein n=1 Tax=[Archangium] primigenium TaxID=2792470 RepID=UPI0019596666|nr:zinc-ribbon domain-containing protein [Archangium primigenium]
MEIACPQCSMKYALDPRLLPPGGVPVQCTRCSHVFIAGMSEPVAPRPAAKPAPKPARPADAMNSTLLYGGSTGPSAAPIPTGTQVFGALSPPPQVPAIAPMAAPPERPSQATQAFGAVPQPAAKAPMGKPPAGKPPTGKPPTGKPPAGKPATGATPAVQTTQVFGAVPVPPAGKPATGATPAVQTTQAFGVVPPPPAGTPKPAGKPPAGKPATGATPAVQTTQAFGVVPPPSAGTPKPAGRPATAPAVPSPPGTPPPPGAPPPTARPPATADVPWGPEPAGSSLFTVSTSPLIGLPKAALRTDVPEAPAAQPSLAQPPGMVPRSAPPERAPPEPLFPPTAPLLGVAATTPIELPDEILNQLNRPLSELMDETPGPAASPGGPTPALSKPLELPPELMEDDGRLSQDKPLNTLKIRRWRLRAMLVGGGMILIGLMVALSASWRAKPTGLSLAEQETREKALALLRRDDSAAQAEALTQLKILSAEHPQSVELLAEMGTALALHLDDTQVQVKILQAMAQRTGAHVRRLTITQTPVDWLSRVNTRKEELAALERRLSPLETSGRALSAEAVEVIKKLDAGFPQEPREAATARLRGLALMNGVMGGLDAPAQAMKLAQMEQREWSALALAEFALHESPPSRVQIQQSSAAMERMVESNGSSLRPYVLGARLALLRHQPAAARGLLETVLTLNPKHELAQLLIDYSRLVEEPDPEPTPEPTPPPGRSPEPDTLPAPTPESPASPPTP